MSFADNLKTVKLSCGEEVTLPRMTIGKILSVTHALSELARVAKEKHPELLDTTDWEKDPGSVGTKILKALPEILPTVADQVVGILASYLGKPDDWIKDNMDLEDLSKVATPFFEAFMVQGNHLLGGFNSLTAPKPSDKPKLTSSEPSQS